MTETSKKRKRSMSDRNNQTIVNRTIINGNWQQFLSSTLLMEKKTEKPVQKEKKEHYTGVFRRSRKKQFNGESTTTFVQDDIKDLNINALRNNSTIRPGKILNETENCENRRNNKKNKITKFIAMDCEMVGVGYNGSDHMLARVSLVNKFGDCIYDKFVKAREEVIDYRTDVSGVRKEDLLNGEDFTKVQKDVAEIISGKILVGHSLSNDLNVLFLSHPKKNIRDTAKYKPFRKITKGSMPSLKRLAKEILGIEIQHGEHSSVEDAKATMQLYCTVAKTWESSLSTKRGYSNMFVDQ